MDRIFKFRGKEATSGIWLYGDLRTGGIFGGETAIIPHNIEDVPSPIIRKETLGQFTGHIDHNGREIYEGDIVEIGFCKDSVTTKHKCGVRWNKLNAGFALYPYNSDEGPWHGWLLSNCKILGNIHDNPELTTK